MLIQTKYRNTFPIKLKTIFTPQGYKRDARYSKARSKQTDEICIDEGMAYDKPWESKCVEIDSYPFYEIFLHNVCQHDKPSLNILKQNDK
jgi:hypothetical protein